MYQRFFEHLLIKQVKPSRSGEMIYDTENVIVCEIIKKDNFLAFDFLNFSNEFNHLKQETSNSKEEKIAMAITLKQQGKSIREIADELEISKSSIQRMLKDNSQTVPT